VYFVAPRLILNLLSVDTESNSTTDKYGTVVNTKFNLLICVECGVCINPQKLHEHTSKQHKHFKVSKADSDKFFVVISQTWPNLVYIPDPPKETIHPLYALKEPRSGFQMCSHCRRCMQGTHDNANQSPSFVSHRCSKDLPNPHDRVFSVTSAQTFGNHASHGWFSVLNATPPTLPSTPWHSYRARMDARPSSNSKMAITPNYRVFHQFISKERWPELVDGKDVKTLMSLVELKSNDPV